MANLDKFNLSTEPKAQRYNLSTRQTPTLGSSQGSISCTLRDFLLKPGADPGILVRGGGVKMAERRTDQLTSETYKSKSFFLQIQFLLDTFNLNF